MEKDYEVDYSKDYQKVHDLVYEYKNGSITAVNKLIEAFEKFFLNYVYLFKYNKCNNISTKRFRSLFSTDTDIVKLFAEISEEDIKHDLIIIFFQMCIRYKDTKPSFHTYISRNFHFYAYRYWEKLIRDPTNQEITARIDSNLNSSDENNITLIDIIKDEKSEVESNNLLNEIDVWYSLKVSSTNKKKNIYNNTFFDDDWLNGITCCKEFRILTPLERKIIKMRYVDNIRDKQISGIIGINRGLVNKRKNIAKSKITEYLKYKKIE